jgi:hypothetical protein
MRKCNLQLIIQDWILISDQYVIVSMRIKSKIEVKKIIITNKKLKPDGKCELTSKCFLNRYFLVTPSRAKTNQNIYRF